METIIETIMWLQERTLAYASFTGKVDAIKNTMIPDNFYNRAEIGQHLDRAFAELREELDAINAQANIPIVAPQ